MLIELTKPHTFHFAECPTGTVHDVTRSLGTQLMAEGTAIEVDATIEIVAKKSPAKLTPVKILKDMEYEGRLIKEGSTISVHAPFAKHLIKIGTAEAVAEPEKPEVHTGQSSRHRTAHKAVEVPVAKT